MAPLVLFGYNRSCHRSTLTLTETEACHVRELIQEDKDGNARALQRYPNADPVVKDFHRIMVELDEGLLEKFKDA